MSSSPCSHCPTLSHQDGPHTSSWLGLWPLGRVLGHSRARLLLLLDPLEGGNSGPSQTPAPLGPQDSGNPFPCSKPEPGAGDVRELILVPTGDSSWAEPSPAPQEMTPQPSPAPTLGGWGVSPQSRLQPSRHHTCALVLRPDPPRPLLPGPTATPAGTGVTDAQPLQLTLTRNKRAPQSPGPGSEGRGGGEGVRGGRVRGRAEAARWEEMQQICPRGQGRLLRLCKEGGPGAHINRPGPGALGRKRLSFSLPSYLWLLWGHRPR